MIVISGDPQSYMNATTDPYKTLFIARINYDTSESKLRREFEAFGPIKKVIMKGFIGVFSNVWLIRFS